jgi:hypothetical protein
MLKRHQEALSRIREIVRNVTLAVCCVIGSLVMLEIAIRFIEPREIMRYFFVESDPVLNHKFSPNGRGRHKTNEFDVGYIINSIGLRDVEFAVGKAPGVFRILMLGDSFTEGNGVSMEQTFSKQLERMLGDVALSQPVQVINAGVGSYSPLLEYVYLKNEGLKLQPDLVILNYDLSDVSDDIHYTALAKFDHDGLPIGVQSDSEGKEHSYAGSTLVGIKDFLKHHTHLYNFVRVRTSKQIDRLTRTLNRSGDIRVDKYAMLRDNYRHADDRDWALSYRYLLLVRDLLESHRIDFWVTVYPYGLQVSTREWNSGRLAWGFKQDTIYSTMPQQYVEQFCKRNAITVLNMCADFSRYAQVHFPLYWDYDGHWTAQGHTLVAHILARTLLPYLRMNDRHLRDHETIAESGNHDEPGHSHAASNVSGDECDTHRPQPPW